MSTNPPTLADVVLQKVLAATGRRVRDLMVEVGPGGVVLRGRAGLYYVKQLAQHAAREVLPTARIENTIVVG